MTNRELAERSIILGNLLAEDELIEIATEDVELDMSRSIGPAQGIYRGIGDVRRFFENYSEAFESAIATPLEFYERGDWMAIDIRVRMRGRGSGAEVEARGARVYQFRDGKIARYVQFQRFDDAREFVDAQP